MVAQEPWSALAALLATELRWLALAFVGTAAGAGAFTLVWNSLSVSTIV